MTGYVPALIQNVMSLHPVKTTDVSVILTVQLRDNSLKILEMR